MISPFEGLSMTRVVGLAAYASAVAACAWRWWRDRQNSPQPGRQPGGVFGVLAAVQLVLLLDIAFNLRWKLHEFFMQEAIGHGLYGMRRSPQLLALWALVSASALCCGLIVWRFRRRRGAAIAVAGTLLSVALRCAEVLSYHGLDAVLYSSIGKMMVVSILWIGLTLLTCLGAWIDEIDEIDRVDGIDGRDRNNT
jgi:hypothetical protein